MLFVVRSYFLDTESKYEGLASVVHGVFGVTSAFLQLRKPQRAKPIGCTSVRPACHRHRSADRVDPFIFSLFYICHGQPQSTSSWSPARVLCLPSTVSLTLMTSCLKIRIPKRRMNPLQAQDIKNLLLAPRIKHMGIMSTRKTCAVELQTPSNDEFQYSRRMVIDALHILSPFPNVTLKHF